MNTKTLAMNGLKTALAAAALLCAACGDDSTSGRIVDPTDNLGRVVLNEINTDAKYIELYNPTEYDADISGYRIYKNNESYLAAADGSGDFAVAEGTTLPAHGYAVIGCKGNDTQYEGLHLGVSKTGISGSKSLLLELRDAGGKRVDTFVNSSFAKPRAADEWDGAVEHAFDVAGRLGDGSQGWKVLSEATPGRSNDTASATAEFSHVEVDFDATEPNAPGGSGTVEGDGLDYVYDLAALPEIHVRVPLDEWNALLAAYDADMYTDEYAECDATFDKAGEKREFARAGLRLKGNTSRRRPEGSGGQMHTAGATDWHHCHFLLNLRKFVKDDAHQIGSVRKLHLKWFKDDPCYAREVYCFDLFRRFGIWTALRSSYCRLWIEVEGDAEETYYGVYQMLEAIDDKFVERRADRFPATDGNLWKCRYGASLASTDDWEFVNDGGSRNCHYELKTNTESFDAAKEQLKDFILKLTGKQGESFRTWITQVCDVELLLRTYAVNAAVGMWDDYWNNRNNFYIYFTTTDKYDYRFYMLPYDCDNTLGTTAQCGVQSDAGRHNPLEWGSQDNPLIWKILQYDEFRAIYVAALHELTGDEYIAAAPSIARIKAWQAMVSPYVANDTGEECSVYDAPASWGNHPEYRLTESGANNFFTVKAGSINDIR